MQHIAPFNCATLGYIDAWHAATSASAPYRTITSSQQKICLSNSLSHPYPANYFVQLHHQEGKKTPQFDSITDCCKASMFRANLKFNPVPHNERTNNRWPQNLVFFKFKFKTALRALPAKIGELGMFYHMRQYSNSDTKFLYEQLAQADLTFGRGPGLLAHNKRRRWILDPRRNCLPYDSFGYSYGFRSAT